MISLVCFLLLAATRVEITNEVYQIPADEWRYVPLGLNQRPAIVSARYEVASGPPKIRLALLRHDDMEKLRAGIPHGVLEVTAEGPSGELVYQAPEPGDYALVIDNQARAPASVHVRLWLDFAGQRPLVTELPRARKLTVVAISFAVFFGIVTFSARRLLKALRR